ncbi:GFA family protein [Marilutibacter chinensis]|uniref:GFA family protein n=1 Tax=Marilutibacter chinensis TaxID=2912247 RepID=A0ABS9HQ75_9GAMM|nr:GFA family protein [Lysobacter chinensis]MCF7220661.1 GFA family protein [Lysobacter chinensis]
MIDGVFEGGCICGAVRYRLTRAPIFVHCCHCTECQRISGSAFAVNAIIEMKRITLLSGDPRACVVPTDTGRTQTLLRCPECGIALWSHHPDLGTRVALVFTGTLDQPGRLTPGAHCFTRSKLPWVVLPSDVPAAEGHYDSEACWPREGQERLGVALGDA